MPTRITPRLVNWASELDDATLAQALKASRLPIVAGHVALMPDAHLGIGATVGSVIPTEAAVIPSAVGVDIGCGMIGVRTDISQDQLPDNLDRLLPRIERAVPAGMGKGHRDPPAQAWDWMADHPPAAELDGARLDKALSQFGTLGSGNHFFEVCLDEEGMVWVVLHSGSRGIGNQLATGHIARARRQAKEGMLSLEDPDLAWFAQDTPEFDAYIADMHWAQDYALANRSQMMDAALVQLFDFVGTGSEVERINTHHNFCARESHGGRDLWITRKGAIKAEQGDLGIIPGSMGTCTYIVRGKGNPESWNSCSHGAGRRYSRTKARKLFSVDDLRTQMEGKVWLTNRAGALLDEIPSCYKDIDQVMADQADLVEVVHTLGQVLNYKGT